MAFRRCVFDIWPGFDERLGRGAVIDGGKNITPFFLYLTEATVLHKQALQWFIIQFPGMKKNFGPGT